jgi:hypothetical protein
MALLSAQEERMSIMAREYARVVGYALAGIGSPLNGRPRPSLMSYARTALRLSRLTSRHVGGAIGSLFDGRWVADSG